MCFTHVFIEQINDDDDDDDDDDERQMVNWPIGTVPVKVRCFAWYMSCILWR